LALRLLRGDPASRQRVLRWQYPLAALTRRAAHLPARELPRNLKMEPSGLMRKTLVCCRGCRAEIIGKCRRKCA